MMSYSQKQMAHDAATKPISSHRGNDSNETTDQPMDGLMSDMIFKLRVNQLATTLRSQGLDGESKTMLDMLESLVIAGEIPFADFMQRVQNLFPHVFDEIAPDLRDNLLRMLSD